jgi:hypothetical protein
MDAPPVNVRRLLAKLRERWANHTPGNPFYLEEELGDGIPISTFCVQFLTIQRSRRSRAARPP